MFYTTIEILEETIIDLRQTLSNTQNMLGIAQNSLDKERKERVKQHLASRELMLKKDIEIEQLKKDWEVQKDLEVQELNHKITELKIESGVGVDPKYSNGKIPSIKVSLTPYNEKGMFKLLKKVMEYK